MHATDAQFGNGTLRLTTRQTYQLHGVLKQDLKTVFSTVIKNMGTTLGACGDVNRNVLAPPAPFKVCYFWVLHCLFSCCPMGGEEEPCFISRRIGRPTCLCVYPMGNPHGQGNALLRISLLLPTQLPHQQGLLVCPLKRVCDWRWGRSRDWRPAVAACGGRVGEFGCTKCRARFV